MSCKNLILSTLIKVPSTSFKLSFFCIITFGMTVLVKDLTPGFIGTSVRYYFLL